MCLFSMPPSCNVFLHPVISRQITSSTKVYFLKHSSSLRSFSIVFIATVLIIEHSLQIYNLQSRLQNLQYRLQNISYRLQTTVRITEPLLQNTDTSFNMTIQYIVTSLLINSLFPFFCIYFIMFSSYYRDGFYLQLIGNMFASSLSCFSVFIAQNFSGSYFFLIPECSYKPIFTSPYYYPLFSIFPSKPDHFSYHAYYPLQYIITVIVFYFLYLTLSELFSISSIYFLPLYLSYYCS